MTSIGDVKCRCQYCDWFGTVYDCEPDVNGEGSLGCPECSRVMRDVSNYEICERVSGLAEIERAIEWLREIRKISGELQMIQRGRDIHTLAHNSIYELECIKGYLDNLPAMETDDGEVIPYAGCIIYG